MKSEKSMVIAFVLNLAFAVFELAGGAVTGSAAIASDALHDLGDAIGIGISCLLEGRSRREADEVYTYGYGRLSVLGGVITTMILLVGSAAVMVQGFRRLISPAAVDYEGMIVFAVIGLAVNLCAALLTRDGGSLNRRAVNLHMLEDVLGWAVVLVGAVVMRFTDFAILDPILSMGVAVYILWHALGNLREAVELFLERVPRGVDAEEIRSRIAAIDGVIDVHHLHIRSMDGVRNDASMHIVTNASPHRVKEAVRAELMRCGFAHVTLETEAEGEECGAACCRYETGEREHGHHHRH